LRIAINDHETENENILKQCPTAIELIHNSLQQNKKVLVHCHAGMQRSCAIVAMYLMKYYKINNQRMAPTNAILYIRSKRPIAFQPVPTFEHAMQTYYTSLQPV
jgi:protein-tyrosine phosphatase